MFERYKGLLFTVISRVGNTGFGAISAVTVAAVFGASGLGVFALLRTFPTVCMILTEFGIAHSYSYMINGLKNKRSQILYNGLICGVIVSILQIIIWVMFSALLNTKFDMDLSVTSLYLASFISPLMVFQLHFVNYLRSIGKIYSANMLVTAVELFIASYFVLTYFTVDLAKIHLVLGIVVSYSVVIMVAILVFVQKGYFKKEVFDSKCFKESFKFGVKSQLGNAFQILNYRLDQLLVGFLLGPGLLGIYVVATKAAELFRFFSLSIVFVLEPLISRKPSKEAWQLVSKYYVPIFLLNAGIICIGFFLGPVIIPVFFDAWSTDSIVPFNILMAGLLFTGANGLIGAYSLGLGKPQLNTYAIACALVVTVILDVVLIPIYGIVGAAIGSTSGFLVSSCAFLYFFYKERVIGN